MSVLVCSKYLFCGLVNPGARRRVWKIAVRDPMLGVEYSNFPNETSYVQD